MNSFHCALLPLEADLKNGRNKGVSRRSVVWKGVNKTHLTYIISS